VDTLIFRTSRMFLVQSKVSSLSYM
jgi:hypothetical protein